MIVLCNNNTFACCNRRRFSTASLYWSDQSSLIYYIVQSMMPALLFMFLSIPILSVNHAILEYMSYFAWVQALIPTKFACFSRIKLSVITLKWHLLGVVLAQMTCRLPAYCSSDNTHIGVKKSWGRQSRVNKVGWTKSWRKQKLTTRINCKFHIRYFLVKCIHIITVL